jgi:hypothetical protein
MDSQASSSQIELTYANRQIIPVNYMEVYPPTIGTNDWRLDILLINDAAIIRERHRYKQYFMTCVEQKSYSIASLIDLGDYKHTNDKEFVHAVLIRDAQLIQYLVGIPTRFHPRINNSLGCVQNRNAIIKKEASATLLDWICVDYLPINKDLKFLIKDLINELRIKYISNLKLVHIE